MEIVSICCNQNVNSVQVELKQWLYKNGDQCVWNTGGWMKCQCTAQNRRATYHTDYYDATGLSANVIFNADSIAVTGTASARAYSGSTYGRAGYYVSVATGTVKPLNRSIALYDRLTVTQSKNTLTAAFRTGAANDGNTAINTATIIKSGGAASLEIASVMDCNPYIVLGSIASENPVAGNGSAGFPNLNFNCNTSISEIYLN